MKKSYLVSHLVKAWRIYGVDLYNKTSQHASDNGVNIWAKELIDGSRVFAFLNTGKNTVDISCNADCFLKGGFYDGVNVNVYDVWDSNKLVATIPTNKTYTVRSVTSPDVKIYKLVPIYNQYPWYKHIY